MPSVMLRKTPDGKMTLYVAKKDLEDEVVSIEFEADDKWGGDLELADGSIYHLEPMEKPSLPKTVRVRRVVEAD